MGKSETLEALEPHNKMCRKHDWPNVDSLAPLYIQTKASIVTVGRAATVA